jgi:transcriptional regulator with AAA-type ATPase domain
VDFTTPVPETAFDSGVQLTLGERVLLSIRRVVGPSSIYLPSVGGIGPAMLELHQRIHTLARLATPVLICGTAGSGKGAVVRALHTLRSGAHPLNAVSGNAEARGSSLHVELFGTADHPGLAAHPGGLWIRDLDALDRPRWGALTQLLDGLYPGGSRPVSPPRVYATTHDVTEVPPALRERFADRIDVPAPQAEDIAWHFADAAVERLKQLQVQRWEGESEGWIRPAQMQALMHRPLTGGLQEVRNLARRAAVESPPAQCSLPADEGLSEPDWLQLLVANDYRIAPTARRAGISPNTLRRRMEEAGLPTAKTLTPGQIQEASSANSADPARMAKQLRVSLHGLRLRLQDDADD